MTEKETLEELTRQTKEKERWPEFLANWIAGLDSPSMKVIAKCLWLIGETGYAYPAMFTPDIFARVAGFLSHSEPLLRARAANALGRMGRGNSALIVPYLNGLMEMLSDSDGEVRLSAIWACENNANNSPEAFAESMHRFAPLLSDPCERTRMEAPEIFRVMGKRLPESVSPFRDMLFTLSETDTNRVVRIHALGAVKAMDKAKEGSVCPK